MRTTALALVGVLLMLCAGCDRPPTLIKVRGKVTLNGQPLRSGTIVFAPDEERGVHGPLSFAVLDQEGAFELITDAGPGAVAGWHRVTVAPPPESADLILGLERYRNPDSSGLRFEVKAGQDNNFTIPLTWEQ
jgi:hypothetical protein